MPCEGGVERSVEPITFMTAVKNVRTHVEDVEVTVHALLHAHNGFDWRIMFRDAEHGALE